jgi:Zn finger protein HypA/HybF involved in hydrogenase expression
MGGCYECTFCGKCTMPSLRVSLPKKRCMECGYVFADDEALLDSCPRCGCGNVRYLSPTEMQAVKKE